jgi:Na+-transporting NADH:ubiquinone oxidoreductase subunit D
MKAALVMALSVTVVVGLSNLTISLIRNSIPSRIRMIVQLTVIAALVVLVDQVLQAFVYDVARQLSVYIGLIITNCIVMGRLEAFAMANRPWPSLLDGLGNGAGYGAILLIVAFFREVFGAGTFFGFQVIPQALYDFGYVNNGLMLTSSAAMFLIGIIIWVHRSVNAKLVDVS